MVRFANSGTIQTGGNGAAGVVIAGDNNQVINSGRITTNGGSFDAGVAIFNAAGVVGSGNDTIV